MGDLFHVRLFRGLILEVQRHILFRSFSSSRFTLKRNTRLPQWIRQALLAKLFWFTTTKSLDLTHPRIYDIATWIALGLHQFSLMHKFLFGAIFLEIEIRLLDLVLHKMIEHKTSNRTSQFLAKLSFGFAHPSQNQLWLPFAKLWGFEFQTRELQLDSLERCAKPPRTVRDEVQKRWQQTHLKKTFETISSPKRSW